jgi:hypothetical protein
MSDRACTCIRALPVCDVIFARDEAASAPANLAPDVLVQAPATLSGTRAVDSPTRYYERT